MPGRFTFTVTEFLKQYPGTISRFALLDHMDWMSSYYPDALIQEWDAILAKAAPGARILLRSAHANPTYLDTIEVGPQRRRLRDLLRFLDELASSLQLRERVHTYAGFVIADGPAWGVRTDASTRYFTGRLARVARIAARHARR